jgi:hypothetical protein
MTDNTKLTAAFKELDYEDEAFGDLEKRLQKQVATGVTDGSVQPSERNDVLEEVAKEFDRMTSLGDTAASFAAYVRGMKE